MGNKNMKEGNEGIYEQNKNEEEPQEKEDNGSGGLMTQRSLDEWKYLYYRVDS